MNYLKHIITILITVTLVVAVFSFVNSFNLKKKIDYYKYSNQVISNTFSKTDKITDDYDKRKYESLRNIKQHKRLKNEQIRFINDTINTYSK